MFTKHFALIATLVLLGCEPSAPPPNAPPPSEPSESSEAPEERAPSAAPRAKLRATPDQDLNVGDTVELCWEATGTESCTLSILHASGEGDIVDDAPPSGCRDITVERTTLCEIFCEDGAHALLQLEATD